MFDCTPNSADSSFSSAPPLPLSMTLQDMHVTDIFDASDLDLFLNFSGQAEASVGFRAKTAFSCELSQSYLENHRIAIPLGAIGPIPITMYLEPTLSFDVSASGTVTLPNGTTSPSSSSSTGSRHSAQRSFTAPIPLSSRRPLRSTRRYSPEATYP